MLYKEELVLNELSAQTLSVENENEVLKVFFRTCLSMFKVSGGQFIRLFYDEDFYWGDYLSQSIQTYINSIEDKIERDRIRKLLVSNDLPTIPECKIDDKVCKGLGYADLHDCLAISLFTDEKWGNSVLNVQRTMLDEALTTDIVEVHNVACESMCFELLEEFAKDMYANTAHERPFFRKATSKNKNDFEHNLLPVLSISNAYLAYKGFYQKNGEKLELSNKDVTYIKNIAKIVALLNGYVLEETLSKTNKRHIYSHNDHDYYIGIDTEKGDFEIHDRLGKHQGATSFDCFKKEPAKPNRKIVCK